MSVKQQFTEEEIYKDRDSQISAIEKTFEDAQKSVNMRYELTVDLSGLCCFGCLKWSDGRCKSTHEPKCKCNICQPVEK